MIYERGATHKISEVKGRLETWKPVRKLLQGVCEKSF